MPVNGLNKAVALNAKFIVIIRPRHFYKYGGFKARRGQHAPEVDGTGAAVGAVLACDAGDDCFFSCTPMVFLLSGGLFDLLLR